MPNFDEISQSTAEIKLLPFSENGRPPYWNSISGFDLDLCVVTGMPFCISLPNIVVISLSDDRWRSYDVISIFSRWPAAAILDLICLMLDHPRSAIAGLRLILKFGVDLIHSFAIFMLCTFGWKLPIHVHFGGVLGAYFPKYGHSSI